MKFSTPTKTIGNITTKQPSVFKNFKELSFAIWKNPNLAGSFIQPDTGKQPEDIVRHYNLTHASRYLGKSEAALRLFLWENSLSADVRSGDDPIFSEEFLDLIDAYGYLFDYSKKWRESGHYEEADNLLKEAQIVFGLPHSHTAPPRIRKRIAPSIVKYTEDWAGFPEEWRSKPVYI